ncbi:hypothetical protein C8R43DRAFT_1244489 [Mycena crocata]|nr:hypothetical protein C8R43DRAFT_1244489 [Mycena crocata]
MQHLVDADVFQRWWNTLSGNIAATCTVLILYALYLVLFLFALRTLRARQNRFLAITSWAMFVLATVSTIIQVACTSVELQILRIVVQDTNVSGARYLHSTQLNNILYYLVQNAVLGLNKLVRHFPFLPF